ncbi:hypothetical protein EQO05_14160 [Methanosarcina sp. MSH10X1]|uniref:hypothetical protein n=1 Tax=Methanosarcina sp. MSH10X1 TaxID=2507075 RepID=UPI000FFCC496|nr:hypothetical protein [Methanosarcina sp. MSH10X1]RXA16389.1 hypothetical protein EQO05_14160 [Methanosarcina sp. MSH10X1]
MSSVSDTMCVCTAAVQFIGLELRSRIRKREVSIIDIKNQKEESKKIGCRKIKIQESERRK